MLPVLPHIVRFFFFLMIRRPPRSTLDRSSAASDVYKRQVFFLVPMGRAKPEDVASAEGFEEVFGKLYELSKTAPVSYTPLRAHETVLDLVCRLLLEKKKPPQHKHH